MNWPWKRKEEELYFEPGKLPRRKETLRQVSEKILIKRMKKDEEFGIATAMKVVGASEPSQKSVMSQLREYKEMKALLSDLGSSEGGNSIVKELLGTVASLPAILAEVRQMQPPMQRANISEEQRQPEQIQQAPSRRIEPAKEPENPTEQPEQQLSLSDIEDLLDDEPDIALERLKIEYPAWLQALKMISADELLEQGKLLVQKNPELAGLVSRLESEDGKMWLAKLIELAKKDKNTQ